MDGKLPPQYEHARKLFWAMTSTGNGELRASLPTTPAVRSAVRMLAPAADVPMTVALAPTDEDALRLEVRRPTVLVTVAYSVFLCTL